MPLEQFITKRFNEGSQRLIEHANAIIGEYMADGYVLTLRQLYYQFVARGLLPNRQKEYKRLGSVINDARLAGLIDWNAIEDRVRSLETIPHWDSPADILDSCANSFHFDRWRTQRTRVEVWVEKDALAGVVERACEARHVPYFACRGYTSQSAQWRASKRFARYLDEGQEVVVLHLGDHDPSGWDMTRDNGDRLDLFLESLGGSIEFRRIALNTDQVKKYNPPPNPVKLTDSRSPDYKKRFGDQSWELDALDPKVIAALIHKNVEALVDEDAYDEMVAKEDKVRSRLSKLADQASKWRMA
jgi:hypothetical protein